MGEDQAWRDILVINPMGLGKGEGQQIAARLIEVCDAAAERAS